MTRVHGHIVTRTNRYFCHAIDLESLNGVCVTTPALFNAHKTNDVKTNQRPSQLYGKFECCAPAHIAQPPSTD